MQRALGAFLLLASTGFILAAFQNCAVYKSPDKTGFEGADAQPVRALGTSSAASGAPDGAPKAEDARPCSSLISDGDADAAFGQPTELVDAVDASGRPSCMISTYQNVAEGADTAVCSASPENYSRLYAGPEDEGRIIADPSSEGPMSEGSYAIAKDLPEGRAELAFLGAETGAKDAVVCVFAFASRRKLEASATLASERGSRLARFIAAHRSRGAR